MGTQLNDSAIRKMIDEDIAWLGPKVGSSLEGKHIVMILKHVRENPNTIRPDSFRVFGPPLPEGWEPHKSPTRLGCIGVRKPLHRATKYAFIDSGGVRYWGEHDDTSQRFEMTPTPEIKAYLEHQWAQRKVI